jgi:sugar lactone lactonase YvrE
MRITRVDTRRCGGGEGALWDVTGQALFYFDIWACKVHRYDPASGSTQSWDVPSIITSLALREGGGVVAALDDGIYGLDLETGAVAAVALQDPPPSVRYNDGKVDRRGRYVIGASTRTFDHPKPDGGVFSLGRDHRLRPVESGINYSNSNCFSPDGGTFYFSDSLHRQTYAYDYDLETGDLANKRLFVETKALGGVPDGSTVDRDGLVWMAIFEGRKIAAFRPDGRVERVVETPVAMPTAVSFGGPDLDLLYFTSMDPIAFGGQTPEEGAGEVYVIEGLGARGLPEPRYIG